MTIDETKADIFIVNFFGYRACEPCAKFEAVSQTSENGSDVLRAILRDGAKRRPDANFFADLTFHVRKLVVGERAQDAGIYVEFRVHKLGRLRFRYPANKKRKPLAAQATPARVAKSPVVASSKIGSGQA